MLIVQDHHEVYDLPGVVHVARWSVTGLGLEPLALGSASPPKSVLRPGGVRDTA